jgi:hypothetical protein
MLHEIVWFGEGPVMQYGKGGIILEGASKDGGLYFQLLSPVSGSRDATMVPNHQISPDKLIELKGKIAA